MVVSGRYKLGVTGSSSSGLALDVAELELIGKAASVVPPRISMRQQPTTFSRDQQPSRYHTSRLPERCPPQFTLKWNLGIYW